MHVFSTLIIFYDNHKNTNDLINYKIAGILIKMKKLEIKTGVDKPPLWSKEKSQCDSGLNLIDS